MLWYHVANDLELGGNMPVRPNGGEPDLDGSEPLDELEPDHHELTVNHMGGANPRPRSRDKGWLKNIVAVLIGMAAGVLIKIVLTIPLTLVFPRDDGGLPQDLELIVELFATFIAGSIAGSLVPRYGWLFGLLTQAWKMVAMGLLLLTTLISVEIPDASYLVRVALFAFVTAAIAGGVAEHFRESIWSFLSTTFLLIGASFGCLLHLGGGLVYLYFLYRGGKALFEEGDFLKALLFLALLGPIVAYGVSFIFMGIFWLGSVIFHVLHAWYAKDLGLAPLEV